MVNKYILQKLREYPNLQAVLQGTVSGQVTEWPAIRKELEALVYYYEYRLDEMIYEDDIRIWGGE